MGRPKIIETPVQLRERRWLAVLVRTLRAVVGWSQEDLTVRLGWNRSSLTKYENGQTRLSLDKQETLMALLASTGVVCRRTPRGLTVFVPSTVLEKLDPALGLSLPHKARPTANQTKRP